jgi:hypothetical protein
LVLLVLFLNLLMVAGVHLRLSCCESHQCRWTAAPRQGLTPSSFARIGPNAGDVLEGIYQVSLLAVMATSRI